MKVTNGLFSKCLNFYKNKNYSSRTIDILKTNLEYFDGYMHEKRGGEYYISDITYKIIEEYKTYLSQIKISKHSIYYGSKKTLSPKTIQMKVQSVKNFLKFVNFIHDEGIDYRNIEIPRIRERHINFLEEDEVQKLLDVVDQSETTEIGRNRSKLLIMVWYTTGLRLTEILSLTVEDMIKGQTTVLGKGKKERIVYFLPKVQQMLNEYIESLKKPLPQYCWVFGQRSADKNYVFISHNCGTFGNKLSKTMVCSLFHKYNKILNIPWKRITCHSLRHSFATRLMDKKINIREIQELLWHSDLKTTETYTHVRNPKIKDDHKQAFDDFL